MRFTIEQVYDAVNALVAISNQPRMIPSMAKYKFARMYECFEPTHKESEKRRIALIQKHGTEQFADPEKTKSVGWGFASQNTDEFKAFAVEWDEVVKEEVEIEVKPIMTTMLGNDPKGIELAEFKQLGDLIVYNNPE